jgi:hypothetical protein
MDSTQNEVNAIFQGAPTTAAPAPSKLSFLKKIGKDIVKGLHWFGSAKGQAVVKDAELIAVAVDPALAPIVQLVNTWGGAVIATEAKAEMAASLGATATNEQKAVAATVAVLPDVLADLKKANLTFATSESARIVNDAVVAIMNELVPAPAPVAAAQRVCAGAEFWEVL